MTMLLLPDSVSMKWERPVWGRDPKTSVLNKWNQMHDVQECIHYRLDAAMASIGLPEPIVNVYGIDGACGGPCCERAEEG